jgi:hypothetical protein
VNKPQIFGQDQLAQKNSPAHENVTYFAVGPVVTGSFTGVVLWNLLNSARVGRISTNSNIENHILHKVIVVTGNDCHQSVFSAGEIDPSFGGNQIMVAYATGGASLDADGFARTVVPADKAGGFVSNVVEIEVTDPSDAGLKMVRH